MSDEELRKLEKEIRDQDQLLTGYQQENERLYDDLKQEQTKAKTAESQMFKENQKLGKQYCIVSLIVFSLNYSLTSQDQLISAKYFLFSASEVAALKEKLERKEGTFEISGTAALGAERIHQLHAQVKILKTNEQELKKEMDTLENENKKLEREMKNLERERDKAVQRADEALGRFLYVMVVSLVLKLVSV